MMPLEVMVPTTAGLTLALPAGGVADKTHAPFGELVTIAGIKDTIDVMSSLQRPKKARACCMSPEALCCSLVYSSMVYPCMLAC